MDVFVKLDQWGYTSLLNLTQLYLPRGRETNKMLNILY